MRTEDLETVLRLVSTKAYPDSPVPNVTGERRRESTRSQLEQHAEALSANPRFSFELVIEPAPAYWLTVHNHVDHATGQKESVLLDHAGDRQGYGLLFQRAAERARSRGDEFFAVRLFPNEEPGLFESFGFRPEFRRIVRRVSPLQLTETYHLRRAAPEDRVFLTRLTLESASFYRSANRAGIPALAWNDMANYLSLDLGESSDLLGWIAELDGERVGYVLVRRHFPMELFEGEAAYLYDIAVRPEHWGRGAASELHEHAVHDLAQLGVEVLVGDISADNPRAYQIGTNKLGYEPEWERWGCNL